MLSSLREEDRARILQDQALNGDKDVLIPKGFKLVRASQADPEQTRMESLAEAFINVLIGFWISFVANAIVLPLVGLPVSIGQNLMIGFFMTFVSVGRQYIIRRWAQAHLRTARVKLAGYLRGLIDGLS